MQKTLLRTLANELLFPLVRRAGTALGAYMVAQGVAQDHVNMITGGIIAAAGVAFDLTLSHLNRGKR